MIEYLILTAAAMAIAAVFIFVYRRHVVIPERFPERVPVRPPAESGLEEVRGGLKDLKQSLDTMDKAMEKTKAVMEGVAGGGRRKQRRGEA